MDAKSIGTMVGVLAAAALAACYLTGVAQDARVHEKGDGAPKERIVADYDQGLKWGGEIVGFAVALAGFLGLSASTNKAFKGEDPTGAGAGLAGVLAGATLLQLGGWAAPAALGALVVGASAVQYAKVKK